jgi:small-conductance mechanosensitive channel
MMVLIMALGIFVAWNAESLITIAVFMLGLSSAEYAANWAQWWWWRFNKWGRLTASFGGPVIFVMVKFVLFPDAGEYLHVLLAILLTTLSWLVVTLLTKPDEEEALKEFYDRARPLGLWGPIRKKLGVNNDPGEKHLILKGLGLALLGVFWIGCAVLALSDIYVGRFAAAGLLAVAGLIGAGLFLVFYRRYMNILEQRVP